MPMEIRALTETYAVSPQIMIEDLARAKAMGFVTIINNRPDGEIPAALHSEVVEQAARALGLEFVVNPIIPGGLTTQNVEIQSRALAEAKGPVLAYCASGNRSSVVWALTQKGQRTADDLIGTAARFGYDLNHLRPHLG
jgi:uncharacterized protein (TIGR01244 family)